MAGAQMQFAKQSLDLAMFLSLLDLAMLLASKS
jgi:hypothetical protein